ncbi:MAG TPA: transcription-repair coupling factor [Polyangiaceae bacterium]|nr:transcription-repair coupling factor [Polyangiaceae bacterium]
MLDIDTLITKLPTGPGVTLCSGVQGCGAALLVARLLELGRGPVFYVLPDADLAQRAFDDLQSLAPTAVVHLLHASDTNPFAATQPDRQVTLQRLAVLADLSDSAARSPSEPSGAWDVVVTNAATLARRLIPRAEIARSVIRMAVNQTLDPSQSARQLTDTGYLRVPVVEDPGTFSVRGNLIDVWGPGMSQPVRIELLEDLVAAIKTFDPDSQRTLEDLPSVRFAPVREVLVDDETRAHAASALRDLCDQHNTPSIKARQLIEDLLSSRHAFGVGGYLPAFYELESIWDYLPAGILTVVEDPAQLRIALDEESQHTEELLAAPSEWPRYARTALFLDRDALAVRLLESRIVACAASFVHGEAHEPLEQIELTQDEDLPSLMQQDHSELKRQVAQARTSHGKHAVLQPLLTRLQHWHAEGLRVIAVARTETQAQRLTSLLAHRGVVVHGHDAEVDPTPEAGTIEIKVGKLARGVVAPAEQRVYVTEEEIFGQRAHTAPARKKRSASALLEDLRALKPGDWVVHAEHGVGRYLGLENRTLPGTGQLELIVVEYSGGKLFLPVYRLNQIQKYSGSDSPKLDRLGGQTFAKTKARAKRRAQEMADELLRLYAERRNRQRTPLPPPGDDYAAFEAAFHYEETSDQLGAINDVMSDLERPQVMDRLVCGDVGFGKTEVALRAAFRVAASGRQVAVLCPTTVLAQQHFLTFSRRLSETPFEARVLSRFQSKKESQDTLSRVALGSVDILVGTHRLLSKDVQFKNLGLIVIDEEQRFGVAHKERLKQLRTEVDVLTLTATPIPRTLQLAIGGLREMSIISTPPLNRRSIRTLVARNDDVVLRDAVERELQRGGQIFYVYNRIEGLHERALRLQTLVPRARVLVAHGQMRENVLEQTMFDFVEGRCDVLVTTAIVESGLDIPRANTMIIDRADLFGLAQLYQLRGRVGRSQERAYCYLLVPPAGELSADAQTRIEALERYSELGSGFSVATLDMELRGTGDLLGADQSGSVEGVGIELFCQMLEEATRELQGEEVVHDVDPDQHFDVDALIPSNYVEEVGVRLSLYKRLASALDENEVMQLAAEMEDRFGAAPEPAVRLVEVMRLKVELRRLKVLVCEATKHAVSLRFRQDTPLDAARLANLVATRKGQYRLNPDGRLTRKPNDREHFKDGLQLADKMLEELQDLVNRA